MSQSIKVDFGCILEPLFFIHNSSSWDKIRLHAKNQLPGLRWCWCSNELLCHPQLELKLSWAVKISSGHCQTIQYFIIVNKKDIFGKTSFGNLTLKKYINTTEV
jgi:hypothetical protein